MKTHIRYAIMGGFAAAFLTTLASSAPNISWTSTPSAALTAGTGYPQSPHATGTSSNGTLATVSIDISVNGTWSPWAYAGGGDGYTCNNMGNTFTPSAGTQYQFRAWATESGGASTGYIHTQVYTVPGISWDYLPASPLIKNVNYYQAPRATGTSAAGNLATVSVDVSQNGGSWTPWAYAGGGNGYTGSNNGNTFTSTSGDQYQFRAVATTSAGASSGYTYSPVYNTTAATFKILIDTNQIGGESTSHVVSAELTSSLGSIASNGVFSVVRPANSPNVTSWSGIFSNLQSTNGLVAETQYSDMAGGDFTEYSGATTYNGNVTPQYSVVYDEASARPAAEAPMDTILQLDQIQQAASWVGGSGKVIILTRAYHGGGGIYPSLPPSSYYGSTATYGGVTYPLPNPGYELRGYYVDIALNSTYCGGVCFEVNPSGTGPRDVKVNEAISATLAKGKKFYLLLPPRNSANYLADIQATVDYLALVPSNLTNSNLTIVPAVYGRDTTMVGFLTGDNGISTNSIASAATFLKSLR